MMSSKYNYLSMTITLISIIEEYLLEILQLLWHPMLDPQLVQKVEVMQLNSLLKNKSMNIDFYS